MAIYRFSATVISRSKGRSSVAAAAYRSGSELEDQRTGVTHDYTRKGDVQHSEILAPDNAPEWMRDREALWNGVESAERRKDAQVAREVQLALPRELSTEQQIELVHGFARDEFVARGMVADVSVHSHVASDGGEQPHAHIMLSMREVEGEGFGAKVRDWNSADLLEHWREQWAEHANEHLLAAGIDARVDHRSLAVQQQEVATQAQAEPEGERKQELEVRAVELDREPAPYLNAAWYMEQRAEREAQAEGRSYEPVTDRGQWLAEVRTLAVEKLEQIRELAMDVWEAARTAVQEVKEYLTGASPDHDDGLSLAVAARQMSDAAAEQRARYDAENEAAGTLGLAADAAARVAERDAGAGRFDPTAGLELAPSSQSNIPEFMAPEPVAALTPSERAEQAVEQWQALRASAADTASSPLDPAQAAVERWQQHKEVAAQSAPQASPKAAPDHTPEPD